VHTLNRKTGLLLMGAAIVCVSSACSKKPEGHILISVKTSSSAPAGILDDDFAIWRTTNEIPQNCKGAFSRLAAVGEFDMADPGQRFQVGDVLQKGLPRRRLIFAGTNSSKCFVHYEQGGRGHSYYLSVLDTSTHGPKLLWNGAGVGPAANLQELRSAIAKGAFHERE
jgi:hypothetical protein